MIAEILFSRREHAGRAAALLFGALILAGQSRMVLIPLPQHREAPIVVALKPPPKPEAPPKPTEPPKPKEPPKPREVPRPKALPRPTPKLVQQAKPETDSPRTPVQDAAPVQSPVQSSRAAVPAAAPSIASNAASEAGFAKEVRQRIEARKLYPAEAQSLGMTGSVTVAYVLDRAGKVLSAEVVASSGSRLLDQAALDAVRKAVFRPIPEDAWVGEKQKSFKTTIDFELDN